MPQYNPYFFQVPLETLVYRGRGSLLDLLGASALLASGLWAPKPPPGCAKMMDAVLSAVEQGGLGRREAEWASMLVLYSLGLIDFERLGVSAGVDCGVLDAALRGRRRVYPKVVNDLRRGYVLVVGGDEEACSDWRADAPPARLSRLAGIAAEEARGIGHRVVGAIVYVLGTLLRLTPAYHLLAVAAGAAAQAGPEPCMPGEGAPQGSLGAIAERLSAIVSRERAARLLAAELAELCEALRVLRGSVEASEALRRVVLRFDAVAETLDPIVYLEGGLGALGVPPGRLGEELEAALARCGP